MKHRKITAAWWAPVFFTVMYSGTLNGAGVNTADRIDELLKELTGSDAARRSAAIVELGKAGPAAASRLASVVTSASEDTVRIDALDALSRNSMAYAYGYLLWEALPPDVEEEPETRRRVWDGLIRVGDAFIASGEYGAASDHYCDLLEMAETTRERGAAIRGLGRASRRRAAEEVFAALGDEDPVVVQAALDAIVDLRWPQALPHLEAVLKTAKPALLVGLLDSLAQRTEKEAATAAKSLLQHKDKAVQAAAGRAVAKHAGFLTDWWIVGPLPTTVPWKAEDPRPEENPSIEIGGNTFSWQRYRTGDAKGKIDPGRKLALGTDAGAWALAQLPETKSQKIELLVRCTGKLVLLLDGTSLQSIDEARGLEAEPQRIPLDLTPGRHRLLLWVLGGEDDVAFSVRVEGR